MRTGLAILLLALGACSTTPPPAGRVVPATAEQVAACQYLDDLVGTSGMYGVFASKGVDNARAELLNKAAGLGATHVVWQSATPAYGGTDVQAKAYRCP